MDLALPSAHPHAATDVRFVAVLDLYKDYQRRLEALCDAAKNIDAERKMNKSAKKCNDDYSSRLACSLWAVRVGMLFLFATSFVCQILQLVRVLGYQWSIYIILIDTCCICWFVFDTVLFKSMERWNEGHAITNYINASSTSLEPELTEHIERMKLAIGLVGVDHSVSSYKEMQKTLQIVEGYEREIDFFWSEHKKSCV